MRNGVSVIIPTYNRASLLCEAIESVINQTSLPSEIIVINDGSTDNTEEVLREYLGIIKYVWQPNLGPAAARNRGIKEAKGDYVAFLDSDDIWVPKKLEWQMEYFASHPYLNMVFGNFCNFGLTESQAIPEIENYKIRQYLESDAHDLRNLLGCLFIENIIGTPTVVIKRSCFERIGLFDESLWIAEDYDLWLRAASWCRIGFVNKVLVRRRRHPGNLINDWASRMEAHLNVLNRFMERHPDLPLEFKKMGRKKLLDIHYNLGSYYLKRKNYRNAWVHLRHGMPSRLTNWKWSVKLAAAYFLQGLSQVDEERV